MNQTLSAFYRKCSETYKNNEDKSAATPQKLAEEMASKILQGDFVLVVSDICLLTAVLWRLKELNNSAGVWYLPHAEEDKALAEVLKKANQKNQVTILEMCYNDFITKDITNKVGEKMKFDMVIMNPPYGKLHLPILAKAIEVLNDTGTCISIQPVRWLQDPLWKFKKNSDAIKMRPVLEGKIQNIQIIPNEIATQMFNALMSFDLGIFTIKKSGGAFDYCALSNERNGHKFGSATRILKDFDFFKKTRNYDFTQTNFFPLIRIVSAGGSGRGLGCVTNLNRRYGVFIDGLSMGSKYGDGLTPAESMKANKRATLGKVTNWGAVEFETANELHNFYNYINLTTFRFFVFVTILDVNVQDRFLPIPTFDGAFAVEWDNNRFCEYFGLTAEEMLHIEQTMNLLDA